MKTIAVYVQNDLADWEASFILPRLRKAQYDIKTFSESLDPVTTLGGIKVLPDMLQDQVNWSDVALLILPGGDSWMDPALNSAILSALPALKKRGIRIAAICGATVAMARNGLLDTIRHTSNHLQLLKQGAPSYKGDQLYVNSPAVTDRNVITASGMGGIEFAVEILKLLKICDDQKAEEFFNFFKHGVVPPAWLKG